MYASLIGAGVSQLYDLYKSATAKSGGTDTSSTPTTSTDATSATSAVKPTASTGASFSDAVQKLLVDLQAGSATSSTAPGTAASADPTNTVAGDLQSVFKASGKAHGGHGHHHASAPPASADGTSPTRASNPFQGLASSLLAYAKNQNLGVAATSSTALTA